MHTKLLLSGIFLIVLVLGSLVGILRLFWLIYAGRTQLFGRLSVMLLTPVLLALLYVLGMFVAEWRTVWNFLQLAL